MSAKKILFLVGFAWPVHPQFLTLFLQVLGARVSL